MCILKSIHYIIVATNIYITIYLHFYNNNISYVMEIGYHQCKVVPAYHSGHVS